MEGLEWQKGSHLIERALPEEYTLPLIANHVFSRQTAPNCANHCRGVVTNLSTSRMIDEVARGFAQPVVRTNIGEGFVVDRALAEHALLAGEGSGGVAILPTTNSFDAFYTLGTVLEAMAVSGESLVALADRLPAFFMRKGTVSCAPDVMYSVLEGFRERFADQITDRTEGVRLAWDDAWMHIRVSNTEPLLRIVLEAETAARADELYDEVMTLAHRMAFGSRQG